MREGQPRREKPRPEGVEPDWVTEYDGMEKVQMSSPTTFRHRRAEALAQFAQEDAEYDPKVDFFDPKISGSTRYHSPRLIAAVAQLEQQRRSGAVEISTIEFLPLKSAAKSFIGCAEGVLQRLMNNNPPTDNERRDVMLSNGNRTVGYSQEYLLRLKVIYETTIKGKKGDERKRRQETVSAEDVPVVDTVESLVVDAPEISAVDYTVELSRECVELHEAIKQQLDITTLPAEKLAFRKMITSLEQLMNDIEVATGPQVQSLMNRMEGIQETFDQITHEALTVKRAVPEPIALQQSTFRQSFSPSSRRIPEPDFSAEADNRFNDIAACDRILDVITTAQMDPTISRRVKSQIPTLRFAINTVRGQLNRDEVIDRNALQLKIAQIERLLTSSDEDDD